MAAARITVLMYHRVGETRNDFERRYGITPADFEGHLRALQDAGFHAVPERALVDWLEGGDPLADGAFVLSFDDGFAGVGEHAAPLLEGMRWPYTVFLVADLLGKRDDWTRSQNPDRRTYPLLSLDEIRDLARRGASFHSHSRSHASLPALSDEALREEIEGSRTALAEGLGTPVEFLAYPYGHVDPRVEAATREAGYRAAFSTQPGFNRRDANPFRIRRLDIAGTDTPAMLLRKVRLGSNDGSWQAGLRYAAGRVRDRLGRGAA